MGRVPQLTKYEVLEELGHGGMATVYRARDRRLGREVAVKVIHPHLRDSKEVVLRFNAEAKAVAKLRHPNIVDVYDVSEPDEVDQYLVVALVRGTTLRRLLQERGTMPAEVAGALGLELLAALEHAHGNGVVHRDVKPENVLLERRLADGSSRGAPATFEREASSRGVAAPLDRPGSSKEAPMGDDRAHEQPARAVSVRLTDFGIAKLLDAQGVTSTGQVLGSPAHMAPEQIEGGEVDARSDVFGAGVLLYECMVGHLPFDGTNPAQVLRRVLDGVYTPAHREHPSVGAPWSKILDRALARAPADRFPSASAMRDAIAAELHRLDVAAPERDLEAWIDDPASFGEAYRDKLVDRLCALAGEARKRGDVLAAAADYNRALALRPHDPSLLRIVAGMNRAERRGRVLRKLAGGGVVALGVAALVAATARSFHESAQRIEARTVSTAAPPPAASASEVPAVSAPTVTVPQSGPTATRLPIVIREPRAERRVTLDLKPPMGVSVSIDGQPNRDVSTGETLTLGARAHMLAFSCPVCTSVQVGVDASEKDSTLVVSVPVKAATLVVDGDVSRTYQIVEHPEIAIRSGTNTVPLRSAYEPVTIRQIETGSAVSIRLEAAKTMHAAFP
jgi:serine/threonine-protein kinase